MNESVHTKIFYLEAAAFFLKMAGLNPNITIAEKSILIEIDKLPLAVIRKNGEVSLGVAEVIEPLEEG